MQFDYPVQLFVQESQPCTLRTSMLSSASKKTFPIWNYGEGTGESS
jgi:hypothetical protein